MTKKILLMTLLFVCGITAATAQKEAEIKFDKVTHNFGKFSEKNGRKMLPISVEGHHGLMDGFHLAKYLEAFQKELNLG